MESLEKIKQDELNTTSNISIPDVKYNGQEEEVEEEDTLDEMELELETMFSDMLNRIEDVDSLTEISYNEFLNDKTKSERQKVNGNINKMYSKLREVDQLCTHALKLKGSLPNDQKIFWKNTMNKMTKILKILSRIRTKAIELNK